MRSETWIGPTPALSILMPVFNGETHLGAAIGSMLNQTFTDFEFLILNDGSTDATDEVVRSFRDPRIRLLRNSKNLGLIRTLNRGLGECRGAYIARMDADDLSLPERLAEQVTFMEQHPAVGVSGTAVEVFGSERGVLWHPSDPDAALFFSCVLAHPSVILRRDFLEHTGLRYDEDYLLAEDWEFWLRCRRVTRLANLNRVLLRYRVHPAGSVQANLDEHHRTRERLIRRSLLEIGIDPTREQMRIHRALIERKIPREPAFCAAAQAWLSLLVSAHAKRPCFHQREFLRNAQAYAAYAALVSGVGRTAAFLRPGASVLGGPLPVARLLREKALGRLASWRYRVRRRFSREEGA